MTDSLRTLSSAQTLLVKVLFPILAIGIVGKVNFDMWFTNGGGPGGTVATPEVKWTYLAASVLLAAGILLSCGRLKKVRIDDERLYVSNYNQEISVPLSAIASVTESRWGKITPVTVNFRMTTEFGRSIVFIAKARLVSWGSHPVVEELRSAARLPPR